MLLKMTLWATVTAEANPIVKAAQVRWSKALVGRVPEGFTAVVCFAAEAFRWACASHETAHTPALCIMCDAGDGGGEGGLH